MTRPATSSLRPVAPWEGWTVGDRIPDLHRRIDLPMLVRYAGAAGDFNPIHYDEAYARQAGLDGVIGHGMLALALVSQAVTEWLGDSGLLHCLSGRFTAPFRLGDRLTVTGEVTKRTVDEEGHTCIDVQLRCTNQDGIEIVGNSVATVRSPSERSGP